jgi:hypothetical protein
MDFKIAKDILGFVSKNIASGALSFIGGKLLSTLTGMEPDPVPVQEILDKLNEILKGQEEIKSKIDKVIQEIHWQTEVLQLVQSEERIKSSFYQMISFTKENPELVKKFSNNILTQTAMSEAIITFHDVVMGSVLVNPQQDSLVKLYSDMVFEHMSQIPKDSKFVAQAVRDYFDNLVGIQFLGIIIIWNCCLAMNAPHLAVKRLTNWQKRLEKQIDLVEKVCVPLEEMSLCDRDVYFQLKENRKHAYPTAGFLGNGTVCFGSNGTKFRFKGTYDKATIQSLVHPDGCISNPCFLMAGNQYGSSQVPGYMVSFSRSIIGRNYEYFKIFQSRDGSFSIQSIYGWLTPKGNYMTDHGNKTEYIFHE